MATPKKQTSYTHYSFQEKRDAVIRFLTHKASIEEIQRQYDLQRYQFQAWVGQVLDRDRTVIGIAARAHTAPVERQAVVRAAPEVEADEYTLSQTMPDIVRQLGEEALRDLVATRMKGQK